MSFSAVLVGWCHHKVCIPLEHIQSIILLTCSSPKFFRKIVYIDTLSDLAHHVPLTQIDIPPAVYQYVFVPFVLLTEVLYKLLERT